MEHSIKILLVGDKDSGKTSITISYVSGHDVFSPTIEDEFMKTVEFEGNQVSLTIRDMAGLEDFSSMAKRAISQNDAFIFVYSTQKISSFNAMKDYYYEVKNIKSTKFPFVIAANTTGDPEAQLDDGKFFAEKIGCQLVEVNLHEWEGAAEVFEELLKACKDFSFEKGKKGKSSKGKRKVIASFSD